VWLSLTATPDRPAASNAAERADFSAAEGILEITTVAVGDEVVLPAASHSARFVEKPWLSALAAFVADRPDGRWVVGKTDRLRPAATAAEAAREARAAAAEQVLPLVRARVPEDVGRHHRLRAAVEAALVDGDRLVVDRFPQQFDRPYGSLYREAVLVDASDAKLAPLVDALVRSSRERRDVRVHATLSATAILVVLYALYRVANAVTRGYFVWSLRAAAAVLAAGAVSILAALG
jgi:hypothetical protein